jgi:hypothetical protein
VHKENDCTALTASKSAKALSFLKICLDYGGRSRNGRDNRTGDSLRAVSDTAILDLIAAAWR